MIQPPSPESPDADNGAAVAILDFDGTTMANVSL